MNLMDLGLSEIERNKRLESLIARRRARKLLSLQVRRTLMNMDRNEPHGRINPIVVPKSNPFPENYSPGQYSPVPGSAPSVLVPRDNPFDLPYDPQEEKPILTGGSFHQDFLPVLQKDMFCRHESFSLGSFYPGEMNLDDHREASRFHFQDVAPKQRSSESWEDSRLESKSDRKEQDKIIEVESSQPPEPKSEIVQNHIDQDVQSPEPRLDSITSHQEENAEEVETKMMLIDDSSSRPSSASSSEIDAPYTRLDKNAILESLAPRLQRNISAIRDSRSENDQDANDSGQFCVDRDKVEDRPIWPNRSLQHKPSFSIASDLQVEVSEISSPPLTFDGSFSSYDEGNTERGVTCSGEDRWAPSPPPSDGDENESRLRDIHEVTENAIETGFSGSQNPYYHSTNHQDINEEMIEDGSTNSHSQSISVTGSTSSSQSQTLSLNSQVEEKFQTSARSEIPSKPPAYPAPRLTDEQMAQRSQNSDSHKPEHFSRSRSLENFQGELRTAYDANYSSFLQRLNGNNLVIDDNDNNADSMTRESGRPQKDWSMTSSPTSIGYPESQFDLIEEHRNMFEYYQPAGENHNPTSSSDDVGGESINLPHHEEMDESIPVEEENNTQESILDDHDHENENERANTQIFPQGNESLSSRRGSELLPNLIVQQVYFASMPSSSPSPRSVLQPKFSIDQRTLSNLTEEMHDEIQHINGEIAEHAEPHEPSREIFIYSDQPHSTTSCNLSTEEARITESDSETEGNTQSLTSPKPTAGLLRTEESSYRISEEKDEMTEKLHEQEPEGNHENSGSDNTPVQLKPEEEAGYQISEQKHEMSEQVHEHEPNANMNELQPELADETGRQKQLPEPVYENKYGFDEPDEAASGINTTIEVKEVDPGIKGAEDNSPDNHITGLMTQETNESTHKAD